MMLSDKPESATDRMAELVQEWRRLRRSLSEERLRRFTAFTMALNALPRSGAAAFNVFSLLDVTSDEVRHSRFLAWLLDARAAHGQGSRFLEGFLCACGVDLPAEAISRYRVHTELSGTEAIVDIVVCRQREFIVYIENKVWAEEGPDQLGREYRDMSSLADGLAIPHERRYAVFLTPEGRYPSTDAIGKWRCLPYQALVQEFAKVLPHVRDDKTRYLLADWLAVVRAWRKGWSL